MKRRGTGRRQVLNLSNDKLDSPRRTWQTKYQQICAEHNNHNGAHLEQITSTTAKSPVKTNPLSGLLGHYHSDSDTEDEAKKDQLDTKVSDFLKEIQTIAPSESSMAAPPVHVPSAAPAGVHSTEQELPYHPAMAWQECYDDTSGYAYYWNVETNEVTWEVPPEYHAYMERVSAGQQEQWLAEQHMAIVPTHIMGHVPVPAVAPVVEPPVPSVERHRIIPKEEEVPVKSTIGKKAKSKRKDSDSDDERIEMITSYGPASDESDDDDDDDEEARPPSRRTKGLMAKSRSTLGSSVSSPVSAKRMEPVMGPSLEIGPQPLRSDLEIGPQPLHSDLEIGPQPLRSDLEIGPQPLHSDLEIGPQPLHSDLEIGPQPLHSDLQMGPQPLCADLEIGPQPMHPGLEIGPQLLHHDLEIGPQLMHCDLEIGPQPLPVVEPVFVGPELPQNGELQDESSLPSADVPDVGAPDDEPTVADKDRTESDSQECQHPVPDSSEDNKVTKSSTDETEPSCSLKWKINILKGEEDQVACSGTSTPVANTTEGESDVESGETDEGVILSRLRSQARILKELGGEIPDEIQHLIEPSTNSVSSPLAAEDVIAQIEKEMPPDYKINEKEVKKVDSQVSSGESSPRTSSFALIAGYGDDSDPEDEKKAQKFAKNKILKKIESGAGEREQLSSSVIESHSLICPKDAEVTSEVSTQSTNVLFPAAMNMECVPQPDNCQEKVKSLVVEGLVESSNLPDSTTSSKILKRKKRLDLDVIYPTVSSKLSSSEAVQPSEEKTEESPPSQSEVTSPVPVPSSSASYTTWTHYNADPSSGVRRGFGFQSHKDEDAGFLTENVVPSESPKRSLQKKGIINFVKADTLNPVREEGKEEIKQVFGGEVKVENEKKGENEAHPETDEIAQLISEKLNFLGEGKEPVAPVQVMTIQLETLLSAWQIGALSRPYWTRWLADTAADLVRLEQVAAPNGWACEWDRTYKRYYYRNVASGETQWEYPTQPNADVMDLCTSLPPPPPPLPVASPPRSPSPPTCLPDVEGDERPKTPPQPPKSPPRPKTPPPPRISLSPKPTKRKRKKKLEEVTSSSDENRKVTDQPELPPLPPLPPPPASPPPPLPPLPSELPPLPPTSPPPLPASPPPPLHRQESEHGQPLPPGVDPPELPYIVARPLAGSLVYPAPRPASEDVFTPPLPPQSPPDSTDMEISQMITDEPMVMAPIPHHMQGQYIMASVYQQGPVVSSSMTAMSMGHAPSMEYGAVPYVGAMPMPMHMPASSVHVIAKPPAKKRKASLHAELDSFYSDLASLESSGSIPPAASEATPESAPPAEPAPAPTSQEPLAHPTTSATTAESEHSKSGEQNTGVSETRKKKKTKLAPGLSLKKKGVSSLVAKWQQVQQEVRRDYKNLDNEDGVSSTHK